MKPRATTTTLSRADSDHLTCIDGPAEPGVIVVFAQGSSRCMVIPMVSQTSRLGRDTFNALSIDDSRVSREHLEISLTGANFRIVDLASRNGTFVDGVRVTEPREVAAPRVLRAGDTIMIPVRDVRPFRESGVQRLGNAIVGPGLSRAWSLIDRAARAGEVVHIHGETGVGKELAARRFHEMGPRGRGPLVPINCAAVPAALAERLFFGVRKGTYTGAEADAQGLIHAADGGTLFLDEISHLDASVQAKLLRVIETHEVLRLGGSIPTRVSFGVCSATTVQLQTEIARGAFREDLYFRIGLPSVEIPPLFKRPEEIPWLMEDVVKSMGSLGVRPSLVERALLLRWPGNVRALMSSVRSAVQAASEARLDSVAGVHLPIDAGMERPSFSASRPLAEADTRRATTLEALHAERGNVSAAARRLGIHRTQLRRDIEQFEIDLDAIKSTLRRKRS